MTITPELIARAALVVVVDHDGLFQWSSNRSAHEVARYLRGIADDIDAGEILAGQEPQ